MAQLISASKKTASILMGVAALALGLWQLDRPEPASAAPAFASAAGAPSSLVEPVQIFRRGRPPIYPYSYSPGRRGGWSTYFGFVPYAMGDYETQALQRVYPQSNYPPSMRAWTPESGF